VHGAMGKSSYKLMFLNTDAYVHGAIWLILSLCRISTDASLAMRLKLPKWLTTPAESS
jgi:hypothetical protein